MPEDKEQIEVRVFIYIRDLIINMVKSLQTVWGEDMKHSKIIALVLSVPDTYF